MKKEKKSILLVRLFASKIFLIVVFVILGIVSLAYARAYYQDYKIKQEIAELERKVEDLENKKLESLDVLKYVMSDEFVEERARIELNMVKEGENMIIRHSEDEADEDGKVVIKKTGLNVSNPVKWFYYFMNKDLEDQKG